MSEIVLTPTKPFVWNSQRSKAAVLVAEDRLSESQIAQRIRCSDRQVRRWKDHPEFQARVDHHRRRLDEEVRRHGIARLSERLGALDTRWRKMGQVIEERGADPAMQKVAGGKTGLLTRRIKAIGSGPGMKLVPEYAVDTGLLRELREAEKQAAQEVGQWTEQHEHRGAVFHLHALAAELARSAPPAILDRDDHAALGTPLADW